MDPTTRRKRHLKVNLGSFSSVIAIILTLELTLSNVRERLLNLNSKGPYLNSESEIKFRRWLFTFSIKVMYVTRLTCYDVSRSRLVLLGSQCGAWSGAKRSVPTLIKQEISDSKRECYLL